MGGGGGWRGMVVLDEPPSLAVTLLQLLPGLGAGIAQGRYLVEQ